MPKISTYTTTTPASGDLLIGSDVNASPDNSTKNFTVGSILNLASALPQLTPVLSSNIVGSLYSSSVVGNFTVRTALNLASALPQLTPALDSSITGSLVGAATAGNFTLSDVVNLVPSASYSESLRASSTSTTQYPSALNTELRIDFGAAQTLTNVSLSSAGTVTFNTAGSYTIEFNATTNSGRGPINRISSIMLAMKKNGILMGTPKAYNTALNVSNEFKETRSNTFNFTALFGDTLDFYVIRNGFENIGGLSYIRLDSASPWVANAPSASLVINKLN
tara:strand:+ start:254 stop:1090 length:837 start_codon:yes stop_codon:yes gene_type:complete